MPENTKIHTVRKGESVWSISQEYKTTAKEIEKLNPKLTSRRKINSKKQVIITILEGEKLKIPISAQKRFFIQGNKNVMIGEKYEYKLVDTTEKYNFDKDFVFWEFYLLKKNSNSIEKRLHEKKLIKGLGVSYNPTRISLKGRKLGVKVIHRKHDKESVIETFIINIEGENRKIESFYLLDKKGNRVKAVNNNQIVTAVVLCKGMERDKLEITLIQNNIKKTKKTAIISNGMAKTNFLISNNNNKSLSFSFEVNSMERTNLQGKSIEYGVNKTPIILLEPTLQTPKKGTTPQVNDYEKVKANKNKTGVSGNEDLKMSITDTNNKKITGEIKFGNIIRISFVTKNLIGKSFSLSIYDDDGKFAKDNLLYGPYKIDVKEDKFHIDIYLSKEIQDKGYGFTEYEGNSQELYVEASIFKGKTIKSEIFDVSEAKNSPKKEGKSPVVVYLPKKEEKKKEEPKQEEEKKEKNKRAPWMDIVLEEAKNYGGYYEGSEPLKSRIKNSYFSIKNEFTTNKTDPTSVSWCATFASWCLQQAGYSNPSSCRALEFNPEYKHDASGKLDRPSGMRRIIKPVYGCIVVWKNIKGGGGHVAFHYGYTLSGNIIPIGGNQGNSLKFSNRSPKGDYGQTIVGYYLPENYEYSSEDEFTEEEKKLNSSSLNLSSLLKKANIKDDKGKTN